MATYINVSEIVSHSFPASSSRTIVTHITRPFTAPKSTRSQASLQPQQSAPAGQADSLPLTNLPYFIRRTPSNQLPIYLVTKAGGTKQETRLRKTEGDLNALRDDLVKYLGLESKPSEVYINQTNGHITIKVRCFPFTHDSTGSCLTVFGL